MAESYMLSVPNIMSKFLICEGVQNLTQFKVQIVVVLQKFCPFFSLSILQKLDFLDKRVRIQEIDIFNVL